MSRLIGITETLSTHHDSHTHMLLQAQNITNDILDTLESTVSSATGIKGSLLQDSTISRWWPHIVYPAASLVMGSYGLPPSTFRNLGLVALGESFAQLLTVYNRWNWEFADLLWAPEIYSSEVGNFTTAAV